jgi:hypothetical protein
MEVPMYCSRRGRLGFYNDRTEDDQKFEFALRSAALPDVPPQNPRARPDVLYLVSLSQPHKSQRSLRPRTVPIL